MNLCQYLLKWKCLPFSQNIVCFFFLLSLACSCLAYSDLPTYCQLVPDPDNQCCEKPQCTYQGTQLTPVLGGIPTASPTLTPGLQNYVPIGTHSVTFGAGFPINPESGSGLIYGGHCKFLIYICFLAFALFEWNMKVA